MIGDFLYKVTEPLLAPFRRRLPDLGGIDLSPVVLIIGSDLIRMLVFELFADDAGLLNAPQGGLRKSSDESCFCTLVTSRRVAT